MSHGDKTCLLYTSNFVEREKNVEKFWKDNDIFKKSMEQKKQGETYTFYDGPPTANGKPCLLYTSRCV